ncbi:hypothetical protein NIES2135_38620 [Leptolyngbya boryana NIES-2135]|jgi:hypothetical protein|uniref:Uncharacterized protein n=1 Tax=Leptolyngbya boryana NIES-2135 TaxID=1973484 RepID=A0A1Z4JJS1_LEPBY|nr:hypothetical protein NIES2135_38620 [Leptolyngbya boryana NIES-2135]
MKPSVVLFAISTIVLATPVYAQNCKLTQAVYRDGNGKGFELVFRPPTSRSVTVYATAVLRSKSQDELYRFNLSQSQGYGSTSLADTRATSENWQDNSFIINFFDSNLKSASMLLGRESIVPKYAFINGLGSRDYYNRRQSISESNPLIGDTMWVFNRCQSR